MAYPLKQQRVRDLVYAVGIGDVFQHAFRVYKDRIADESFLALADFLLAVRACSDDRRFLLLNAKRPPWAEAAANATNY